MIDGKKILAVIPARGGSKRLPSKNTLPIAGKPLIQWTIDAALKSKYVDYALVSTDCQEIARVSSDCGANVPFLRPALLATDEASSVDAVIHALEELKYRALNFDIVLLLQPTSPLRDANHIDEAVELFVKKAADVVISVCKAEHPPQWINYIPEDGSMVDFLSTSTKNKRSQDFSNYYRLNGALYLAETEKFASSRTFFIDDKVYSYIMSNESSIDIDEKLDFEIAEVLLGKLT